MDCKGECHYLNHGEHDDRACCLHDHERLRVSLPLDLKRRCEERARRSRLTLGQFLRVTLETYGTVTEVYLDDDDFDDVARVELTLPTFLANLVRARDRAYVARRARAFFLLDGPEVSA